MASTKPAKKTKRGRARTRQQQKPTPLPWMDIVDELNEIRALLRIIPDLTALIEFISNHRSGAKEKRDRLSRWAGQALGINLEATTNDPSTAIEHFPDLDELPFAPEAVQDAARWRLRRLSRLVHAAIKADLVAP